MKDPLIQEATPYELFGVMPLTAQTKDVMKKFPQVRQTVGAQVAQNTMQQLMHPERRLVLDLLNYYWVEESTEIGGEPELMPNAAAVVGKLLQEAYPPSNVDLPIWTDLDRNDFSDDFRPIERCISPDSILRGDFRETDPEEILEPPEVDF